MSQISNQAVVSKKARIGERVEIGPFAIIEDDVEIGAGVKIWPHAYIAGGTSIGEGSQIHMGAVVGHLPQDLAFKNTKTFCKIGKNTVIREYATIHRGTEEGSETTVGDNCYLMAVSHVGHNCHIGNNVILANCALLAGHVTVGDHVFISGNVVVHQFCRIGTAAIIGGFTGINKDVPPYMLVRGPSVVRGVNLVGLRRLKFSREAIKTINEAYRLLYKSDMNTAQAIEAMRKLGPSKEIDNLINFIQGSKRGICKYKYSDDEYFE
ncbi:MAG: acyl-ACP--UDP-N-acetylglucosamine O-acyltransferase [Candidatus Omnitrophica bacterium]|nr:acyl-ACP--UDP-N-acetylglucosamine O-acyltransferase [Candidatus Omnitrophota bacterium]MCM8790162.1 acyl-ACP--UDP-N-acetylglucosamine O-acyltransferase [Candidatus Omnitrophota bacterium]